LALTSGHGRYIAVTPVTVKYNRYKFQWRLFEFAPGVFYTYFYDNARRFRLEKLLLIYIIELSRSFNGYFKPLLDPGSPLYAKGDPIFRVLRDGPQILEF
jgi:hypothetical protein